jgi:hypothetical protein
MPSIPARALLIAAGSRGSAGAGSNRPRASSSLHGRVIRAGVATPSSSTSPATAASSENGLAKAKATRTAAAAAEEVAGAADADTAEVTRGVEFPV